MKKHFKVITLLIIPALIVFMYLSKKGHKHTETESAKVLKQKLEVNHTSFTPIKMVKDSRVEKEGQFSRQQRLRSKAILTKDEKQSLNDYLSNPKNIRLAYLTLISRNFDDIDQSIEKRINATNFLIDGLQRSSIQRDQIIKSTEMFLLNTNEEETADLEIRRAIIGDKVDLYNALLRYAPEAANRFKLNYMTERLKKVIKYVEINNKRNRG